MWISSLSLISKSYPPGSSPGVFKIKERLSLRGFGRKQRGGISRPSARLLACRLVEPLA